MVHGIPAKVIDLTGAGLDFATEFGALNDGSSYGKSVKATVYIQSRPLLGHGPYRYFFHTCCSHRVNRW